LINFENKKQLIKDLKEKYPLSINDNFYSKMVQAFTYSDGHGWIDKNKIMASDLDETFLTINNEEISLSSYIASFNKGVQFMNLQVLTKKDLEMLADDFITQNLLFLDALQKGADQDALIKDKLSNKENKLLLTKYLQEELGRKVVVSDAEARQFYDNNRDKWTGEYKDVETSVKFDLRNKQLHERRRELIDKLKKKYKVRYNELLLEKVARQLTDEKSAKRKDISDLSLISPEGWGIL